MTTTSALKPSSSATARGLLAGPRDPDGEAIRLPQRRSYGGQSVGIILDDQNSERLRHDVTRGYNSDIE